MKRLVNLSDDRLDIAEGHYTQLLSNLGTVALGAGYMIDVAHDSLRKAESRAREMERQRDDYHDAVFIAIDELKKANAKLTEAKAQKHIETALDWLTKSLHTAEIPF